MMAKTAARSKGFPAGARALEWTRREGLLDWLAKVRARQGPTAASNDSGPRVISTGDAVIPATRRHDSTLIARAAFP